MGKHKGKEIIIASQDESVKLEVEVDKILETVAKIVDAPEMVGALITDESVLSDFIPMDMKKNSEDVDQFLNEISAALNTKVKKNEFIIDIAKRVDI